MMDCVMSFGFTFVIFFNVATIDATTATVIIGTDNLIVNGRPIIRSVLIP